MWAGFRLPRKLKEVLKPSPVRRHPEERGPREQANYHLFLISSSPVQPVQFPVRFFFKKKVQFSVSQKKKKSIFFSAVGVEPWVRSLV